MLTLASESIPWPKKEGLAEKKEWTLPLSMHARGDIIPEGTVVVLVSTRNAGFVLATVDGVKHIYRY